jgi:hypothetical protein
VAPTLKSLLPATPPPASNGNHAQPAGNTVAAAGIQPGIQRVSGELDNLLVSLQRLIATTDPLLENTAPEARADADVLAAPAVSGPYAARNLSRGEYAVVRLMQSARQFGRDLRALYGRS